MKNHLSSIIYSAPTITALRPTQRDPGRVTIKVDGKAVGALSGQLITDLGLVIGMAWDDALAQRVAEAVLYDKAFRAATQRLARRMMSRGMVDAKLRELGHEPPVRQRVLARLEELEMLDDAAFGRALIRETTRAKPAGPRLLSQKLAQKGLDRPLIDRLVAEAASDPQQQSNGATELARRKLRSMRQLDPAAQKRRLHGQLARRGFDPDAIHAALEEVLKADDPFE